MSSEPIRKERAGHLSADTSNRNGKNTIHAPAPHGSSKRTYCGKGTGVLLIDTGADGLAVTCSDCAAAKRADEEGGR